MKTQISVNNSKLDFSKEKVANLSENEMNAIIAGNDEEALSTRTNLTCTWCTSTIYLPPAA